MSWGKISIRKSDALFSQYLRKKRGYRCEKCGRQYREGERNFGVSHFWGRRNENVRYDENNCDVLCNMPCHQFFEENPENYREWKLKKLGKKEYTKLKLSAQFYCKRDDLANEIYWKLKLKEIK